MTWTIYVIDAFTSEAFAGNPAAVVFGPFPNAGCRNWPRR